MEPVAIIDFEASCLPEDAFSYPIEVALAKVGGTAKSWLIKPAPEWQHWDWCDKAEALHGISRGLLEKDGLPIRRVLAELKEAARGHRVYADSDLDAFWLETLATACRQPLPFPVLYLGELFLHMRTSPQDIARAESAAAARLPLHHVACKDAQRLAKTVELLSHA